MIHCEQKHPITVIQVHIWFGIILLFISDGCIVYTQGVHQISELVLRNVIKFVQQWSDTLGVVDRVHGTQGPPPRTCILCTVYCGHGALTF